MKKTALILLFTALFTLFITSCATEEDDIIKSYSTAIEAAEICGTAAVEFVPNGYEAASYNVLFGYVFETEYKATEVKESDDEMAGTAVLRMVDAQYNVTNLSGFANAGSADVYTYSDEREFEIKTREGVYMAEWTQTIDEKPYSISYTVFDNGYDDPKDALFNYKMMLKELLDHLS